MNTTATRPAGLRPSEECARLFIADTLHKIDQEIEAIERGDRDEPNGDRDCAVDWRLSVLRTHRLALLTADDTLRRIAEEVA